MTTFRITDITIAGAYCNAMAAASESDRRHRARIAAEASRHARETESRWRALFKRLRGLLNEGALVGDHAGMSERHAS